MPTTIRKIKSGPQYRSVTIEREAIDDEARTVALAFSSEMPVERWFGTEILDHAPQSVRLGRLNSGGPLLVDHDTRDHVGVVESVSIDADRRGRAVVRFGKSARADEVFNDVKDSIRKCISVGYRIHKAFVEARGKDGDPDTVRVTDWEPLEISIVSVPADASVGVGRNETPEHEFTIEEERQMPTPNQEVDVQAIQAEARNQARTAELARMREVNAVADKFGLQTEAREFLLTDKPAAEFKDIALRHLESRPVDTQTPVTRLDMTAKETQGYSLFAAIRAAESGDWSKAGLERECSIAIAERVGRDPKGFFVPFNVQARTMSVGTPSTGGYLVDTKLDSASFIDKLRARSVLTRLGAVMINGLVGDVDIPKKTGNATFYWVAEDVAATDSNVTVGQLSLRPRTIAGAVPMTRKLLKQSSLDAEMLVLNDLVGGAALGIDKAGLRGSGVDGEPMGVANTTGINTQAISTDTAPTWAEIVGLETQVAADDADVGSLAYVMTPTLRGALKTTVKDAGSGQFIWAGDNTPVNGYRAEVSSQLATSSIMFGNWADLIIAMWGVLDIQPDKATKAATGGLVLRVFQDVDIGLRNVESFCKGT